MSTLLRLAACGLLLAGLGATAQSHGNGQPTQNQVVFAGRLVDGIQPEAQRVSTAAMARQLLNGPLPLYPTTASDHFGGFVQLLVLIDDKGAVVNVLASDGPSDFVAAASSSVLQWTFRPFGKATAVATIPLLFLPGVKGQPGQVVFTPAMVHLSGGVLASHNTHKAIPSGARGTAVFHVVVDPHGAVAAASMVSGPPQFRDAWEQALADWRYQPYILKGEPVWVDSTVSVTF
jgi:hypothetical protein